MRRTPRKVTVLPTARVGGTGAPRNSKEQQVGPMRRYKVHFWLEEPWDGDDRQNEEQIAAAVRHHLIAAKVRPLDNRVCVNREYTVAEYNRITREHIERDRKNGVDWTTPHGCSCAICTASRGAVVVRFL